MADEEAVNRFEPQSATSYRRKSAEGVIKAYFYSICVLFILVLTLFYSNVTILNKYKSLEQSYTSVFENVRLVNDNKNALETEAHKVAQSNMELKEKISDIQKENEKINRQMQEMKRKHEELAKKNKELVEDNIALQNTLKMAAAVGVKPQSFTRFDGLSSRGNIDRGIYIGKFTGTAYTPSTIECGNNKGITNCGKPIIPGISLAVDGKYWPFGTVFYIKGLGYAVAMDTGSAIKGKHRFDFAVFDKKFAKELGLRKWDVYLVKRGNGSVEKINI